MNWQVITGTNLVIAAAYLAIASLVLRGLARTRQLQSNRLGLATGLIFLTCAAHHAAQSIQMLLPSVGVESERALAMREAWYWPSAGWGLLSATVAVLYLSLRGQYAGLLVNPGLFEDLRARQRQALAINDNIVQGLARVKWALESGRPQEAHGAADQTLEEAQRMVTSLLEAQSERGAGLVSLRRDPSAGVGSGPV